MQTRTPSTAPSAILTLPQSIMIYLVGFSIVAFSIFLVFSVWVFVLHVLVYVFPFSFFLLLLFAFGFHFFSFISLIFTFFLFEILKREKSKNQTKKANEQKDKQI